MRIPGPPPARAPSALGPVPSLAAPADRGITPAALLPAWRPSEPTAASRFDRAIAEGTLLLRSGGPEGTKRLLTRWDRQRLEAMHAAASPEVKSEIDALLTSLGGEAGPIARALLLRAIVARATKLADSPKSALVELSTFAHSLPELPATELLERATVLDLDSTVNSNTFDPIELSNRRGTIKPLLSNDDAGDNDGLFQRFTASCGPTVLQMMLCEADPMLAATVHTSGIFSDRADDGPAAFQRKLLEAYGGVAIGRREARIRARIRNALGRLKAAKAVTKSDAASFTRFVEEQGPRTKAANRVLKKLREKYDGFPAKLDLQRLAKNAPLPKKDEGIGTEDLADALAKHVSPVTGVQYVAAGPDGGFARGQVWRYLDAADAALREGKDIPFGVVEPGHWMLMTHAKGKKPHRSFLVSDPEGGRTAWVREPDLINGTFTDKQFHLCTGDERGYIDSIFLPE